MGHIDVAHVGHVLPTGRMLLDDASFRIGEGTTAALVGPNGAGKTTLIRIIAGDLSPQSGTVAVSGGLGVMRQFVGGIRGAASAGKQNGGGIRGAGSAGEQIGSAGKGPGSAGQQDGGEAASPGAGAAGAGEVPAADADASRPASPTPAASPATLPSATC